MSSSSASSSRSRKRDQQTHARSLLCSVKFSNRLPPVPFPPKFLPMAFDHRRFVEYQPHELEQEYKHKIWIEQDVGVEVDLLHEDAYKPRRGDFLSNPIDLTLVEDDVNKEVSDRKRKLQQDIPFLQKPVYMGVENKTYGRAGGASFENRVAVGDIEEEKDYDPVAAIEKTFEEVKKPPVMHPTKKDVTLIDSFDVLPDFEQAWLQLNEGQFDGDPAPRRQTDRLLAAQQIRFAVMQTRRKDGMEILRYCIPDEETARKRAKRLEEGDDDLEDGEPHKYEELRNYKWVVRDRPAGEDVYLLAVHDSKKVVTYKRLEQKIRLSKLMAQRPERGEEDAVPQPIVKTKLTIMHRPWSDDELEQHKASGERLLAGEEDGEDDDGDQAGADQGQGGITAQDFEPDDDDDDDDDAKQAVEGKLKAVTYRVEPHGVYWRCHNITETFRLGARRQLAQSYAHQQTLNVNYEIESDASYIASSTADDQEEDEEDEDED